MSLPPRKFLDGAVALGLVAGAAQLIAAVAVVVLAIFDDAWLLVPAAIWAIGAAACVAMGLSHWRWRYDFYLNADADWLAEFGETYTEFCEREGLSL